ncbi:ribonuclease III [Rhodoplanes sp. Z2-YC6860]|uniref:ribonuclease III n=1 Tax=Rhodoplanes sp. Z2-YC6860 TaxID=674703 RepID=UPI00078BAFFB|nr:ribonuclease III [Rhodoplanes sp. Z2-YC6860]AMN42125.1 Ribonuclease III [Rhodoplanes sp. Z2-YC6860]
MSRRGAKSDNASKTAQRDSERAASTTSVTKSADSKAAQAKAAETKAESKSAEDTPADVKLVRRKRTNRGLRQRSESASALEKTIEYRFKDRDLLERSLTHISAMAGGSRANSYQRLEFLGDHVLGLIISDMLFQSFVKADEGELSRRLADLVRRETCADVAREMQLGEAIRLGASEANAGGRTRTAILADVCEAVIGAVYLDGGFPASVKLVEKFWGERMRVPAKPLRDPKTMLQEWAQARSLPTPAYKEVERTGPHHSPVFRISVTLPDREPAEGIGRSKRSAEQAAAEALLKLVGVLTDRPNA